MRVGSTLAGASLLLAIVLVACGSTAPSASPSAATGAASPGAATPSQTPSSAPTATSAPPPTATPTAAPTPTATAAPSVAAAPFACTKLPYHRPNDVLSVRVTDVRVGSHAGYDRIVYEFGAGKLPDIEVAIAEPPFKLDPSDLPVTIDGRTFLKIRLNHVAVETIPSAADDLKPGYPMLVAVRQTTGYEGDAVWIAGLSGPACVRVSIFSGPARLVVDVAPAG